MPALAESDSLRKLLFRTANLNRAVPPRNAAAKPDSNANMSRAIYRWSEVMVGVRKYATTKKSSNSDVNMRADLPNQLIRSVVSLITRLESDIRSLRLWTCAFERDKQSILGDACHGAALWRGRPYAAYARSMELSICGSLIPWTARSTVILKSCRSVPKGILNSVFVV